MRAPAKKIPRPESTASPEAGVGRGASRTRNPGTEPARSRTVTPGVSLGAPRTRTDPGATQEAGAEGGTAVAAREVEVALTTVAGVTVALTVEADPEAILIITGVGQADPTPMTVTTAGVAAEAEAREVTVTTGLGATTGVPDPMARTAKATAVIPIIEAPAKAADTAESIRFCTLQKFFVSTVCVKVFSSLDV